MVLIALDTDLDLVIIQHHNLLPLLLNLILLLQVVAQGHAMDAVQITLHQNLTNKDQTVQIILNQMVDALEHAMDAAQIAQHQNLTNKDQTAQIIQIKNPYIIINHCV